MPQSPSSPKALPTSCGNSSASGSHAAWGRSYLLLLLAVHTLSSCFPVIHALRNIGIKIRSEPAFPLVGEDFSFFPGGVMEDTVSCLWTRGEIGSELPILLYHPPPVDTMHKKTGYDGRQFPGPDCSLHIKEVTFDDVGLYAILKNRTNMTETGRAFLMVLERRFSERRDCRCLHPTTIATISIVCVISSIVILLILAYTGDMDYRPVEAGQRSKPSPDTPETEVPPTDKDPTKEKKREGELSVWEEVFKPASVQPVSIWTIEDEDEDEMAVVEEIEEKLEEEEIEVEIETEEEKGEGEGDRDGGGGGGGRSG